MPFTNELMIQPIDLQNILEKLKELKWSGGPVIIRDMGTEYVIRDINDQHIATIEQEG